VCLCNPLLMLSNSSVKEFHATTNNCWRRRFTCGPCRTRLLVLPRISYFVNLYFEEANDKFQTGEETYGSRFELKTSRIQRALERLSLTDVPNCTGLGMFTRAVLADETL
jgi:hypothetical protein